MLIDQAELEKFLKRTLTFSDGTELVVASATDEELSAYKRDLLPRIAKFSAERENVSDRWQHEGQAERELASWEGRSEPELRELTEQERMESPVTLPDGTQKLYKDLTDDEWKRYSAEFETEAAEFRLWTDRLQIETGLRWEFMMLFVFWDRSAALEPPLPQPPI